MQRNNTINFERANPLQGLQQLARCIALPHEYAPTRYPSFPALERTAVMSFNSNASYTTAVGDSMGMLCRQAVYPLWLDQSFTTQSTTLCFDVVGSADSVGNAYIGQSTTALVSPLSSWFLGALSGTSVQRPAITGTTSPAVPYPVVGMDNAASPSGREFYYVPAGWIMYACVGSTNAVAGVVGTIRVSFDVWLSPGEVSEEIVVDITMNATMRAASGSLSATTIGKWYRVQGVSGQSSTPIPISSVFIILTPATLTYTPSATHFGSYGLTAAGAATSLYPFFYPIEFANSTLPWYSTRTTASSLLMTNVTQVLNKSGSIIAGRISPQVQNPWAVTKSYVSGLHPAEKAMLGLENGFYTYVPPSTDMSEFWDYTIPTIVRYAAVPAAPVYRLDNTSLVNVFFLTAPVAETFAVNCDYHIEFRTTSTLWQLGMSALTLEAFHQAQIELMSHGFFYNNHDHMKLKGFFKSFIKKAREIYPSVASFLPPQVRIIAGAANQLIPHGNNKAPAPTSAAASGIVKKAKVKKPGKKKKVKVKR